MTPRLSGPAAVPPRGVLAQALRALRGAGGAIVLLSLVSNLLMLVPTLYMLQVYDRVLASRSELTLLAVSMVALFLFGAMALAELARSRLLVRTAARLDGLLAERVFTTAFAARLRDPRAGTAQAVDDLYELRQFLGGPGIFAFLDLPWTPVYLAVLFLLHPLAGAVGAGFVLVQAALAWWGHHRTVAPSLALAQAQGQLQSFLAGKLRTAHAIEAMGLLPQVQARWAQLHALLGRRHATAQGRVHRAAAWSRGVRYAQQSLALAVGALLVIDGQLSVGGMIAVNVLMARALAPIDQLVSGWRACIGAGAACRRLEALLADPAAHAATGPADSLRGRVELRGVSVRAHGRSEPILSQLDLQAPRGTLTVVLGPSGSGKSTLARLLVGVWPASDGGVWLDGRPLGDWSHETLGPQVGYVPQDAVLFAGTIAQNIARFAPVDAAQVVAAAQCAGVHEMVLRLPQGYDTPVGEGGHRLSGGQRQRIALARALFGDPPLVVLDEPNAHLDEAGEAALLDTLRQLRARGRTVFVVAHRGGVVPLADQLLVLRAGRVWLQGPRDAVLAQWQEARMHTPFREGGRPSSVPLPA